MGKGHSYVQARRSNRPPPGNQPRNEGAAVTANVDALIEQKISQGRKLSPEELSSRPRWTQLRDAATRLLLPYL